MPIRPENRGRYPPSWNEISRRIRFERAEGQCECEGECGHSHSNPRSRKDTRCGAYHGWEHPVTSSIVVLTMAHLDHTPENCDDDNLKAMCQRCHNAYDMPMRRRGMQERARAKMAAGDLFDGEAA